jgi:hypothetical protein
MKRINIIIFTLIICLCFCTRSIAQQPVAAIQNKFEQYATANWQEKLFVHTDKSFYLAGETIWFKIYNTDAHFNRPLDISKVAYVELLDAAKTPVLQAGIHLSSGSGDGSFQLPFSIRTGNYMFRAYTSWMKNSSPDFYFEKTISIVNTLQQPVWTPIDTATNLQLRFFPEGGNMVYGMRSRLAFQSTNQYGHGVDGNGFIISQSNDTVCRFQTLHTGIGSCYFTPQAGNSYRAIIKNGNSITNAVLPAIYEQGYVMNLQEMDAGHIKVTVTSNVKEPDSCIYLFVHTRQIVKLAACKNPVAGVVEFVIDKHVPGEGVSHVTVFNAARQPVCERLYFKRPQQQLMIDATVATGEHTTRGKIDLDIATHNKNDEAVNADISVSVCLQDELQHPDEETILTSLWLTSDLAGVVESPAYYFSGDDKTIAEATDNLLLTHGWRRFDWNNILSGKKTYFHFLPEYEGPTLQATITNKQTGAGVAKVPFYFAVPGQRFTVNNSISNDSGQAMVVLGNAYGKPGLIVQPYNTPAQNLQVDISRPFATSFSSHAMKPFRLEENWKNVLNYHSINVQAQRMFSGSGNMTLYNPALADSNAFYGQPDKTYMLDNYTRFHSMEEVFHEFIPQVRLRKTRDRYHFSVFSVPRHTFFDEDPLVLFDGVPVTDISRIVNFDPLKIQKIDVVTRKYYQSYEAYSGIISFSTYEHDLAGFQLDPQAVVIEYDGLQLKRTFYSPVYETSAQLNSHAPDMRNVLYWSPQVITNGTNRERLSFYASDVPGNYVIVIQGITADGLCGSAVSSFKVASGK